jgi:hypothetical protein
MRIYDKLQERLQRFDVMWRQSYDPEPEKFKEAGNWNKYFIHKIKNTSTVPFLLSQYEHARDPIIENTAARDEAHEWDRAMGMDSWKNCPATDLCRIAQDLVIGRTKDVRQHKKVYLDEFRSAPHGETPRSSLTLSVMFSFMDDCLVYSKLLPAYRENMLWRLTWKPEYYCANKEDIDRVVEALRCEQLFWLGERAALTEACENLKTTLRGAQKRIFLPANPDNPDLAGNTRKYFLASADFYKAIVSASRDREKAIEMAGVILYESLVTTLGTGHDMLTKFYEIIARKLAGTFDEQPAFSEHFPHLDKFLDRIADCYR